MLKLKILGEKVQQRLLWHFFPSDKIKPSAYALGFFTKIYQLTSGRD